jgi:hypothetical protein
VIPSYGVVEKVIGSDDFCENFVFGIFLYILGSKLVGYFFTTSSLRIKCTRINLWKHPKLVCGSLKTCFLENTK